MIDSNAAARAQLTRILNEALRSFRGQYAMFGGMSWSVVDVTREAITVDVHASGRAATDPVASATKLRNCTLGFLQDIVPSARFVARMRTRWDRDAAIREIELPYAGYQGSLENNVLLIEDVCAPKRAELRLAIAPLWAQLGVG